jgi:hypothetical protein
MKTNADEIFNGDYSHGNFLVEDHYINPEPRYLSSDIAKVEPFDIARTLERFGNATTAERNHHYTIVSRRFYDFCVSQKLPMDWVPVHVDKD